MKRTNFICTVEGCGKAATCAQMCAAHYKRAKRHGSPTAGRVAKGERLKWLKAHVRFDGPDCLVPPFIHNPSHWQFQSEGKWIGAHRWMCEQKNGPAPTHSHQAAHSCGRGHTGCVNPMHLRWATPKENNADKIIHGTFVRGEDQVGAKLTGASVLQIKRLLGTATHGQIAERFGVSRSTIGLVANGKTWTHVGADQ